MNHMQYYQCLNFMTITIITWIMLLLSLVVFCYSVLVIDAAAITPGGNYQECKTELAQSFQYCNMSMSHNDRIESLLQELTLIEKLGILTPDPNVSQGELDCYTITNPINRMGIGRYMWLTETNSQVNSKCYMDSDNNGQKQKQRCATAFPGALGLASTFNTTVWYMKGDVISTEIRALYNSNGIRMKNNTYIGLTGFGPNINIARDPRFGRTSELPGEDPYLNGQYATHYVQGMQQIDNNGYIKMLAFLKHFTAYSREVNRGHDTYNITQHMLFDTYLPAYENAMKIGKASGVMCSYNGINGRPACTNDYILNEVMRQKWNLPNAIVMTDCGVVELIRGPPLMAPSPIHAVAWTLGNGTDIEAGDHLFTLYGEQAVNLGLLNESIIDNAVRRVLKGMMLLGRFDHPYQKKVSWSSITSNSIGSAEHSKIRDDAARQTAVLLRNVGNVLPLRKDNKHHTIVIVGPQAATGFGLLPDYWGDQACPSHDDDHDDIEYDCIVTLYEAIQNIHTGFTLLYSGVDEISIDKNQTKSYQEAIEAVKDYADIVILALGISKYTEYETIDRNETILPGLQNQFALDVLNIAKEKDIPAIVILVNGGTLSVDDLMPKRTYQQNIPTCYQSNGGVPPEQLPRQYAIIEAYNPSFGAKGIAEAIFGIGPISWGRMVTTMYPKTFIMTQPPDQYDLSVGNGLTYRYHTGDVLATFGEGMSHEEPTMSKISCNWNINDDEIPLLHETSPLGTLYCRAWNFDTKRQLSSLVMIYVRASEMIHNATPYPIPRRALKAFQRVMVDPTKHVTFEINITVSDIMFVNEQGNREALPGRYFDMIDIWDGWDNFDSFYVNLPIHNQGIRTSETQ